MLDGNHRGVRRALVGQNVYLCCVTTFVRAIEVALMQWDHIDFVCSPLQANAITQLVEHCSTTTSANDAFDLLWHKSVILYRRSMIVVVRSQISTHPSLSIVIYLTSYAIRLSSFLPECSQSLETLCFALSHTVLSTRSHLHYTTHDCKFRVQHSSKVSVFASARM